MMHLKQLFKFLGKQPLRSFFCIQYKIGLYISERLWTFFCHAKMSLHGIDYGKGRFCGNTLFYIEPEAHVTIGNEHAFNSICKSNFRGVNHKCIIEVDRNAFLTIGDNCGFSGVSIVCSNKIVIGNNVLCGTNVMIGDRNDHEDIYPQFPPAPIEIGNNVWIGMNSVIMKGVHIGDYTIIGANSIVTHDIPSNSIAVGNPCKVIKNNNPI